MAATAGEYALVPLTDAQEDEIEHELDKSGFWCLLVQHASNTGGDRTSEYLFYLLLVMLFRDTLLPSAVYGFATTLAGIIFSRWTGTLVDAHPKLSLVRACILVQKLSASLAYLSFSVLFSSEPQPPSLSSFKNAALYSSILLSGSSLRVSTIAIQIAVEKDWVIAISNTNENHLSRLNVSLRRVDLFANLLSPLIVSIFTTTLSYRTTAMCMIVVSLVTLVFELYWVQIVYRAFPELERDDARKFAVSMDTETVEGEETTWRESIKRQIEDWSEFVRLPVFLSSLAVSLLYITVLSFDGNMLGYLKTKRYDDTFLAIMRGLGVLTGLLGTVVAPTLERRLGSVRAGSWSIWYVYMCFGIYKLMPSCIQVRSCMPRSGRTSVCVPDTPL